MDEPKEVGFMDDDSGNKSSMRLMCFISLLAAIGFGAVTLLNKATDGGIGVYITLSFLLGAFAPKAVQKVMEKPPTK